MRRDYPPGRPTVLGRAPARIPEPTLKSDWKQRERRESRATAFAQSSVRRRPAACPGDRAMRLRRRSGHQTQSQLNALVEPAGSDACICNRLHMQSPAWPARSSALHSARSEFRRGSSDLTAASTIDRPTRRSHVALCLLLSDRSAQTARACIRVKGAATAVAVETAALPLKQPRREVSFGADRASGLSPQRLRSGDFCFSRSVTRSRTGVLAQVDLPGAWWFVEAAASYRPRGPFCQRRVRPS